MPTVQDILARLGPCVEENQCDHGYEEGSQHGDSHMSEHGEDEECEQERERSRTPPSGREHYRGETI